MAWLHKVRPQERELEARHQQHRRGGRRAAARSVARYLYRDRYYLLIAAAYLLSVALALASISPAQAASPSFSDDLSVWDMIREGWREGGLAFIFFAGLAAFVTGRVYTRRQYDQAVADWKNRYEENDKRWRERFEETAKRETELRAMLYQQMGWTNRVVAATERVAAAATSPPPSS